MEGHKFFPKSEKQKKKTCVDHNMSIYRHFFVYNYSVRLITVLLVLNLTELYLKGEWGGSGGSPPEIFTKNGTKSDNSRGFHEFMGLRIEVHSCVIIREVLTYA